jgi:hypothetical protein
MGQELICSVCNKKGDAITLQKKNDTLVCPKCGQSWLIEGASPLGRYQEFWVSTSSFLVALLRPELPSNVKLEPGLNSLYEDCYQTLLIGRYNASIVMMGVFLEALMKERIRIKTGKDFTKPYGECVDKLKGIKRERKGQIKQLSHGYLIEPKDILFLDRFREKVRNIYAHFDETKLVEGRIIKGWEIPFDDIINLTKFEAIMKEIESGQRKPLLLHATHPALRSVSKLSTDRMTAVRLFNLVYDYMLGFVIKYLRPKDYDEHNKEYRTPLIDLTPILNVKLTSNSKNQSLPRMQ